MKLTLDTNILISGTFWTGASFKILERIENKLDQSVTSKEIISEYERIMESHEIIEKIENKNLIILKICEKVMINSIIVEPKTRLNFVKEDPQDNMILECAKEGSVDFIVTNDNHLLKIKKFEGITILKPEEYLKTINKQ
jgi:uncharacterized protein